VAERHDADLLEFERLRTEIDGRTQLAFGLVTLEVTALGAGLSVFERFPDVVVGLAVVSSILWTLYLDHSGQVRKLAAYIGLRLAPRLRASDHDVLGWESFLRELDAGGEVTRRALGNISVKRLRVYKTRSIELGMNAMFGGTPLVLLALAALRVQHLDLPGLLRLVAVVITLGFWVYGVHLNRIIIDTQKAIDAALLAAGRSAPSAASTPAEPAS